MHAPGFGFKVTRGGALVEDDSRCALLFCIIVVRFAFTLFYILYEFNIILMCTSSFLDLF